MPATAISAPIDVVAHVVIPAATWGLRDASPAFLNDPLDEHNWNAARAAARFHGVLGLLAAAGAAGAFPLTAAQAEEIATDITLAQAWRARLDDLLIEFIAQLSRVGIDARILKGPVVRAAYPDPAVRLYRDVDVLVRSEDFDASLAVLGGLGFTRKHAEPRPGFAHRFGKAASTRAADGREVDLHRTLAAGFYGAAIPEHDLFATAEPVDVGLCEVLALDPEARFLHACYHAVLGGQPTNVGALRDVAQLALTNPDWERVVRRARLWRGGAVVRSAIEELRTWFGYSTPALDAVSGRVYGDRRDHVRLKAYRGEHRSYGAQAITEARAVRGVVNKIRFTAALLVPQRSYLDAHDRRYSRRFRRAIRLVLRRSV